MGNEKSSHLLLLTLMHPAHFRVVFYCVSLLMLMNARSIDASAKLDHLYIFPDPENNLIKYLKGFSQQQTNICLKVMTHAERQSPRPMHKMNPCASKLICQDVTPSCAGVGAPSASTSPPSPALHQSDRERETYAF